MDSFLKSSDITDLTGLTQKEGVDTFIESDISGEDLNTSADNVISKVKSEKIQTATPKLKSYIDRNPASASSISEDIDKLSKTEKFLGGIFTANTRAEKSANIGTNSYDLMMNNYTSEEDRNTKELFIKNEARELSYYSIYDQPDDSLAITLPGKITTSIFGMVDSITRNPKLAGSGAIAGAPFGPIGATTGALLFAGTTQTFKNVSGQIWYDQVINQPSKIATIDGGFVENKIDKEFVKNVALGTGFVSSSVEAASTLLLFGSAKSAEATALKGITAKSVSKMLTEFTTKGTVNPILQSLATLGKTVGTEFVRQGLIAGGQNVIEQTGNIIASPETNPTQFSVDKMMESILVGTGTGLLFRATGAAYGKLNKKGEPVDSSGPTSPPRDVTPGTPPLLPGPKDGGGPSPIIDVEVISDVSSPTTGTGEARPKPAPKTLEMFIFERNLKDRIAAAEEQKNIITEIADDLKEAKSFKTPAMDSALSKIVPDDAHFYFDTDAVSKLEAQNTKFRQSFEKLTGTKLMEDQGIYTLSASELFKLYSEDKRILDFVTTNPKEESLDTLRLMDEKWKNNEIINTIFDGLDIENISPEDRNAMDAKIHKVMMEVMDGVYNKETYILRPFIDKYVESTIPLDVQKDLEKAVFEERAKIADQILAKEKNRADKLIFSDLREQLPAIDEKIKNLIAEDQGFNIERIFRPGVQLPAEITNAIRFAEPTLMGQSDEAISLILRSNHKSKKPYSLLAFDYENLPESYKDIWKNPRVKAKKIFVKGGLDFNKFAEPIAKILYPKQDGEVVYDPVRKMLNSFLSKETQQEFYERMYDEELKFELSVSEKYFASSKEDYERAFQKKSNVVALIINIGKNQPEALKTFIQLLGRKFTTTKKSKDDEYIFNQAQISATYYSYAMKVKDLNPEIYSANAKKFSKKAGDSLSKGQFLEFFRYKYNEALNIFIEENSAKLRKQVQDRIRHLKRINTVDTKQMLYRAGQEYVDAFYGIVDTISGDVFRYDDLQKAISILAPYREHNLTIPNAVLNLVNRATKFQVGDFTVAEALGLLDTAISIHSAASNDLIIKRDQEIISTLDLEKIIEADLSARPESNPQNFKELTTLLEARDKKAIDKSIKDIKDGLSTLSVSVQNAYTIVRELDYGKEKGFYSNLTVDEILKAHNKRGEFNKTLNEWLNKSAEKWYGLDNFNNILRDVIYVDELKDTERFPNKAVNKWDLLTMAGLFGSETGRDRVLKDLNFKESDFSDLLEKYLTPDDLSFVSDIHKYFRNVDFERTVQQFKDLKLPPPTEVLGKPYILHGQTWLGGYWPIYTNKDLVKQIETKQATVVDSIVNGTITRMNVFSINTFDGSLESRNKNATSTLRYGYNDFLNVVRQKNHHAAFAQPMLEMSKIFGNRNIQKSMINFMGIKKYANLLSTIQKISVGDSDYDTTFQQHFDLSTNPWLVRVNKNMYTSALGLGVGTAFRQFMGVPTMVNALIQQFDGDLKTAGAEYLTQALKQSVISIANLKDFRDSIKAIAQVSPQFQSNLNVLAKYSGWRTLLNLEQVLDVRPGTKSRFEMYTDLIDGSVTHILLIQLAINTVMWKIAYKSAMEGKIIGIEKGDEKSALVFAEKMVNKTGSDETGLDRSPLQRSMVGQALFAFRNQINLQNNELIGGFQMLGAELKNQHQVTSKGIAGAILTILASSVIPATVGVVSNEMAKAIFADEKPKKYESKPLLQIAFDSIGVHPLVSIGSEPLESVMVYNQRIENVTLKNPVLDITSGLLQTIAFAAEAIFSEPNEVVVTKERVTAASRLLTTLLGLPSANMIPMPFNPEGKSVKSIAIQKFVEDLLKLPSRREILTKARGGKQFSLSFRESYNPSFGDDLDVENINPLVISNESGEPVKSESQVYQEMFDNAVDKIKKGGLTPEQKSYYEQTRDIIYSLKGYTNPEGNEITTTLGTIKLDDYGRDFMTVTIDAIARLESGARAGLTSQSGAKGYFQFLDSTWQGLSELYPNFNLPPNANLASKELQYQIYWKFLGENLHRLNKLNQDWTSENIFLIHMMGPNDFKTFIEAEPNTDLTDLLPTQFRYNPSIMAGRTKANILKNLEELMDRKKVEAEQFLKSENLLTSQE